MPTTNTDAILHYGVGVFGEAGYAVPNWGNDPGTNNPQIFKIVNLIGQNLFNIMQHEDVHMRTPPSINTLRRVHKLYVRSKSVLAGRAVPPGVANMETMHVRPAGEVFRVYPTPFFLVRNDYLREWAGLVLIAISEAMQHTENVKEVEISTTFAGQIGQYLTRIYANMSIELFGKTREEANAAGFELTEADLVAYDPTKFFTGTELTDTVPRLDRLFTEDSVELLREGIPVTHLPELRPWPNNLTDLYRGIRTDATIGTSTGGGTSSASGTVMPPAPQP